MDGTPYDVHFDQFFPLEYTSHTFDSAVTKLINLLPTRRKLSNPEELLPECTRAILLPRQRLTLWEDDCGLLAHHLGSVINVLITANC